MTDARDLTAVALSTADLLVRVRTVQAGLRLAETRLREQMAQEMTPGDRRYGTGLVQDGKVTYSKGGEWVAHLTDEAALTEWVVEHYPEMVRPVIKGWFLDDIKAASVKAQAPCGPGGEMVPGIDVGHTMPELKVFAARDAVRWVAEQWAAVVAGIPALPGGE